jgi:hypothetical protein
MKIVAKDNPIVSKVFWTQLRLKRLLTQGSASDSYFFDLVLSPVWVARNDTVSIRVHHR